MNFIEKIKKIRQMRQSDKKIPLPSNHFFLEDSSVLAFPRGDGDTRQPYIYDGMMVWGYACGYIRALEGKFNIFPEVREGEEPHVAFFVNVDGELISLLGIPILNEASVTDRYTVLTDSAIYYFTEVKEYTFAVRMFLSAQKEILFSVGILSEHEDHAPITVSSYFNPYLRNDNNCSLWYRYFKEGKVHDADTVTFYVTEGDKKDCNIVHHGIRQFCAEQCNILYREQTTKKAQFNGGINCNLNNAFVARSCKIEKPVQCTAFNDYAVAGDVTTIQFEREARLEYRFATSNDKTDMSGAITDSLFEEIDHRIKSNLDFSVEETKGTSFSPETLTAFLRKVQYQVNICALGKDLEGNGCLGFRDVAQQVEQCLVWNPEDCRDKILLIMNHMFPDGRAPRTFSIPQPGHLSEMFIPDYIDMGIWMINAIDNYLRYTGDYTILDEICGYYEIVDESEPVVKISDKRDSLLCHMIAIVDRLIRNIAPDSNCVRMRYADWNDAIDSLGNTDDPNQKFGTGVSVMATLQTYQNLGMMNNIFRAIGGHEADIARYEQAMETLKEGVFSNAIVEKDGERRIMHGWGDKKEFFVGSFCDVDGKSRVSSTSQSFFALSSLYDKSYEKDLLNAYRKLDDKYGFRTFDVSFDPDLQGVGRIGKLPKGTAENAGTYIHAALFAVLALYKIGCEKEATEQLLKLFPISYEWVDKTPYVMQNAYCYNPEINVDGSALNDWFTGSAAVMMKIMVTNVFGIQPDHKSLRIAPAKETFLNKASVSLTIHGKKLYFRIEKTGQFSVTLNGKLLSEDRIPYAHLQDGDRIFVNI